MKYSYKKLFLILIIATMTYKAAKKGLFDKIDANDDLVREYRKSERIDEKKNKTRNSM